MYRFLTALLLAASNALAAEAPVRLQDLIQRAEAGERGAMHQLAESYYAGSNGAEQDFKRAAQWYHRLAKNGDVRAQTSLGLMYARGYGVAQNMAEALRWWNFAAIQNDPGAQYNLGLAYSRGEGTAVDFTRALHWYREAARRGHVQAQHNLGLLYAEGKGAARDPQLAYYWVRVAALQGDLAAEEALPALRRDLDPAQLREAEAQAADWMKRQRKLVQ
jgi:TPR repeat protein